MGVLGRISGNRVRPNSSMVAATPARSLQVCICLAECIRLLVLCAGNEY